MTYATSLEAVADAYAWHRALGNECVQGPDCRLVIDRDHPSVWSSNHVSQVRAVTETEIEAVFDAMETAFSHCGHRYVSSDHLTPPQFLAHLAMRDYRELTPTLQMVLCGNLAPIRPPPLNVREVRSAQDWEQLAGLVRADHDEGARTHHAVLSDEVSRGIVEGFRRKTGPCRLYIASISSVPCAYGMEVSCPGGIGMVEDLYTRPDYRGRGIASALIRHCVENLRREGHATVFIGAHISERPKHLYHRLGFRPLMLTREFVREV